MAIDEDFLRQLGGMSRTRRVYETNKRKDSVEKRISILDKQKSVVNGFIKEINETTLDFKDFLDEVKEFSAELYAVLIEVLEEAYRKLADKLKKSINEIKSEPLPSECREAVVQVFEEELEKINIEQKNLEEERDELKRQLAQAKSNIKMVYIALGLIIGMIVIYIFLFSVILVPPEESVSPITSTTAKTESSIITPIPSTLRATVSQNRFVVLETSKGTIKFELFEKRAPITTQNFISLVESDFYTNMVFHRVVPNFVIQSGDPTGTGSGGSGKKINLEIHPELIHELGAVGMARTNDPNSATSQFYIVVGDAGFLDGKYAVFGKVIEGMDITQEISKGDKLIKACIVNSLAKSCNDS